MGTDPGEPVHVDATVAVDELDTTDLDERFFTVRAYQDFELDGDTDPTVMTGAVWTDGPS